MSRILLLVLCFLSLLTIGCDDDEFTAPTDYIERMRWEYPRRLPDINDDGEAVFGANVVTDTGIVLYVASGVDRNGGFFGPYRGEGCLAYQNIAFDTAYRALSIQSRYCARPEIGDPRSMNMGLTVSDTGRHHLYFTYDENQLGYRANGRTYTNGGLPADAVQVRYLKRDTVLNSSGGYSKGHVTMAGVFSAMLVEQELRRDTIWVRDGRFSCRVGVE